MLKVKALLFDVFGTVVDWRTGIAREVESVAKKNDISLDPFDFADAWRAESVSYTHLTLPTKNEV